MKKFFKILAVIAVVLFIAFFAIQKKSIPIEELKKKYANSNSKFLEIRWYASALQSRRRRKTYCVDSWHWRISANLGWLQI